MKPAARPAGTGAGGAAQLPPRGVLGSRAASLIGLLTAAILASPAGPAPAQPRGTLVASARFMPAAGPMLAGDGGIAWVSRDGAT